MGTQSKPSINVWSERRRLEVEMIGRVGAFASKDPRRSRVREERDDEFSWSHA